MANSQDWQETLDDLDRRRRHSRGMGGQERLDKHRGKGKLDARARIERLLDPGTFREIGTLVGGDIAGRRDRHRIGSVNGEPVMVGAEDFTTLAGTIGPGGNSKRYRIAELAVRDRIPLVMLLDGAGFGPPVDIRAHPTDLLAQTQCSGRVPTVAAVLGPSAGHGALVAPVCDFRIMSRQGAIFTAGPPVVKESTGEDISKEDLGGPDVAVPSGVIHNVADDDETVLDDDSPLPVLFPAERLVVPAVAGPRTKRPQPRPTPELLDIVSRDNRRVYDMRAVLDVVFDRPDWFEVQPPFGKAIICALAHLGGHPVAVVANQPQVLAGSIDANAADKAAHFILVADSFHLPIVFLADNPGMLPGSRSERDGVLRSGARMFAAQTAATTIKLH